MRIGFFTDSYFPEIDGVTYTLSLWREELEARDHTVYIIYPDGDYDPNTYELPVPSLPNPFYSGYRIPLSRPPSTLPPLDIVHCHGPASVGLLGRYYASKHDLPAVYTHHTPLEEYFHQSVKLSSVASVLSRLYVPAESRLLQSFDTVTASTNDINRDVDHIVLPVGIDMDFFRPTSEDWYPEQTVIGYSGRLSMEKNVGELLAVARRLPEYLFVIVGEGPRREALEANAPSNVTLRSFLPRDSLPTFYSSIDVFLTASTGDTLGLSTLEANACGTPVVAPSVTPFDRTIGPNSGEHFSHGDYADMVTAIEHALNETYAPRSAVAEYDVTRTIDRLESLYRRLDSTGASPASSLLTDSNRPESAEN